MAQVNQGALPQILFRELGSSRGVSVRAFQQKEKSWKLENGTEVIMTVGNAILMAVHIEGVVGMVEVRPRKGKLTKEQVLEDICEGILKVRAL